MASNPSSTNFQKVAANANERMIARINAVWNDLKDVPESEDKRVLGYIREALTPEAIEKRHEDDKAVGHLHDVAKTRLRPYEKANEREDA
jgi:hypothetical protein